MAQTQATDLFLGIVSRAHKDLDIGILRRDVAVVLPALPGWQFFVAKDGILTPLDLGKAPRAEVNSLWCAYLAPEIQLLYKARSIRAQDQADFDRVVPQINHDERRVARLRRLPSVAGATGFGREIRLRP